WGPTPYDTDAVSAECGIVAFLALGDGWHNWHHTFQWDYAGAELSALKQFNPTKVFIDIMHYLGLAYNLRRANPRAWESLKTRKLRNNCCSRLHISVQDHCQDMDHSVTTHGLRDTEVGLRLSVEDVVTIPVSFLQVQRFEGPAALA
ncbi:hypothetical protein FOZ63_027955, partial [Perkinsus olseni]